MHLLVAPPAGRAMHGLTDRIMAEVIDFCLRPADQGGRGGRRVVVEPDARNDAIIEKNRAAGFSPVREARILMGEAEKRALVSVCTRADFDASALAPLVGAGGRDDGAPHAYAHLNADAFAVVQRHLVAKALSEFAHERLITPLRVSADAGDASADAGAPAPPRRPRGRAAPPRRTPGTAPGSWPSTAALATPSPHGCCRSSTGSSMKTASPAGVTAPRPHSMCRSSSSNSKRTSPCPRTSSRPTSRSSPRGWPAPPSNSRTLGRGSDRMRADSSTRTSRPPGRP